MPKIIQCIITDYITHDYSGIITEKQYGFCGKNSMELNFSATELDKELP